MKKIFLLLFTVVALLSCGARTASITVTNQNEVDRMDEIVECSYAVIADKLNLKAGETIVIVDEKGVEQPYQMVYKGEKIPQRIIFPAHVEKKSARTYTVKQGVASEFPTRAYGRFVPERLDDYAWENDQIAFRAYGPALETAKNGALTSPGYDIWVKRTDSMVINKWYAVNDYHKDHGQGLDCYKVGRTLGGGSSSPYINDTIHYSRNYATYQVLDNGPLRTSVKLTYPENSAARGVVLEKTITLDAGSQFNRIEECYKGLQNTMEVAAGIVIHPGAETFTAANYVALIEPASDSKSGQDGLIAVAVIMPEASYTAQIDGNLSIITSVQPKQTISYYSGAGWSKNGFPTLDAWQEEIKQHIDRTERPLLVAIH